MQHSAQVLVTGGNGALAIHCIHQLLKKGYHVRTSLRSLSKKNDVLSMLRNGGISAFDQLSFIEADLTKDDNWDAAMKGCKYVLHVASPTHSSSKNENEMIGPAVEGVLRVLQAAKHADVKRVVLTSSFGALGFSHKAVKGHTSGRNPCQKSNETTGTTEITGTNDITGTTQTTGTNKTTGTTEITRTNDITGTTQTTGTNKTTRTTEITRTNDITGTTQTRGTNKTTRTTETTEADWTDPNEKGLSAYEKSKVLAERAAWDFINTEGGDMELSVINPVAIYGPSLGPNNSPSLGLLRMLLGGQLKAVPNIPLNVVDIRDVADLHLRAMENPAAAGQRFIATADGQISLPEIARLLKAKMPAAAAKVSLKVIPDGVLRIMRLFNPQAKTAYHMLSINRNVSNAKAKKILGWTPSGNNETAILAAVETMLK
ncbi:NAD-dependent epimerase/dehydratase family protein [Chitinophaga silvisoli]|uniref:NAD-dependent epimerase/dehydratase family protein n=1 Tax=Chitinophaga silvisoli TaxID=2291814 RepID=A0A3E1NT58_9BACT|nr:NAD-dependent epimerase/dehydratase family protein [Chitinophaga silvisoli]RFM31097.1 NAD-dependent epimerase/dehydratase family protein [Chitinophaga silvisoli]